ncbi:T9SS type A sorting domain-containing protein [Plebeiibacterium marinum]|uniref:T9SS type A sorting domain-containing protein n=1 Tax=Plebeiibacterium marinum TaxID=2992111 RepID=A0AAE3SKX4_9BACT|nr:T9SS type A sorting domain-containing protein [Plebeiobacterium marinum]MCW3805975.1 T9SS type A sorting domain-containing protein [Plebeiobacterium marinum]
MRNIYFFLLFVFLLVMGTTVQAQTTWYLKNNGDWNVATNWTQDPAAAVIIPTGGGVPAAWDNIVIPSARKVTVPDALNLECSNVTIYGEIDLATSTGHTFNTLMGNGVLSLASGNFPAIGDDSDFVTEGEGEGTVKLYGNTYSLTTDKTFYNLEVNLTAGQTVTLGADYTINGNLTIKSGKLDVGNSTTSRSVDVLGNVSVEGTNAYFEVGDYNAFHNLTCYGDFFNSGTVKFTNQSQPDYGSPTSTGALLLTMAGSSDNSLTCNNTTDLYRLIINKGTDQTYTVSLSALSEEYFRLYCETNVSGAANKSLYLQNGTLKLSGNMFIPSLTEGGSDFEIPTTAQLWLNSSGVTVYSTARSNAETTVGGITGTGVNTNNSGSQSFTVKGKLRITEGTLDTKSHGLVAWNDGNAIVQIEGGVITTPGLRSAGTSTGRYSYLQSGGSVTMYGEINSDGIENTSATFSIKGSDNVFSMTGGTLEIQDGNDVGGPDRAIEIESAEGNYNVTGGTIRLNRVSGGGADFYVASTAPLGNLEVLADVSGTNVVFESEISILGDVTINANATINTANYNLSIGGDFTNSGTYTPGTNATIFNGSQNSSIVNTTVSSVVNFNKLVIDKDENTYGLSITADSFTGDHPVNVSDSLTIYKGQFDLSGFEVDVQGDLTVLDGDILDTEVSPGLIVLNDGSGSQVIRGSAIYNPSMGYIEQDNSNGISIATDVEMEDFTLTNGVLSIGDYRLTVNSGSISGSGFSSSKMIQASGGHGARGLRLKLEADYTTNDEILYPVGTPGEYTNCIVTITGDIVPVNGYLTVAPVAQEHPTHETGKNIDVMAIYWKTIAESLSGIIGDVQYDFYYDNSFTSYGKEYYYLGTTWAMDANANSPLTFEEGLIGGFATGDFTAGENNGFKNVTTVYTVGSGDWTADAATVWSGGSVPESYEFVEIRDGHTVTMDGNSITVGSLDIQDGGKLDVGTTTGHSFNIVKGDGTFSIASENIPTADYYEFMNSDLATFEYYGATDIDIPSTFSVYPNLLITGTSSSQKLLPDGIDVLVRKDLTVDGDGSLRTNDADDLIIQEDLIVSNGGLFEINNGNSHQITVYGSIDLSGAGTNEVKVRDGSGNANVSILNLYNDILLSASSVVDLYSDINKPVELHFVGDENSTVDNSAGADLDFSEVVINKSSLSDVVYINGAIELLADADEADKPLNLISGECHLENSGSVTISSGGYDFDIPSGTILRVDDGTTLNVTGNNKGIWLDGSLIIEGSGVLNNNGGTNNYIEYSSSGDASISLAGTAQLRVGSQIRRSLYSDVGTIDFSQNSENTTVVVGDTDAGDATRGVFEIVGGSSSFSQAENAEIVIERGHGSSNVALELSPGTSVINSGAGFVIGNDDTPASHTISVCTEVELENLTVEGVNNPTVQLLILPATLNGTLDIQSGSFNANSLDLTINGNLSVKDGDLLCDANTTTFSGIVAQTVDIEASGTGSYTFDDVVLNSGNTLTSGVDLTVNGDLTISSGTLNSDGNVVNVKGDLVNNGITLSGSGDGIVLNNTTGSQNISGSGSYGRLTINNGDGVVMPSQSSAITITEMLKLEDGIFDIGRNLMVLTNTAVFDAGATYSGNFTDDNMIQTNLSFTDAGIKKVFSDTQSGAFVYPVGSFGLYTPVTIDFAANGNSTGSIRVKAANEPHITISGSDMDHVLQYNWTLDADGITGFQGDITMQADASDEPASSDPAQFIGVRFELGGTEVNLYQEADDYNETLHTVNIDFNEPGVYLTDDEIDGDYTAGESSVNYDVKAFISVGAGGNWTNSATWDYYDPDTGATSDNGTDTPRGAIVYIADGTTVVMDADERVAYASFIQGTGRLEVGTTLNHRLGSVSGTGTLSVMSGSLPAGIYTDFCSASGGTLEYAGSFTSSVLSETSVVNNISFLGSGTKTLPNYETEGVTVLGNLIINGPTVQAYTGQDLNIEGDLTFTSGTFDANDGKVIFNGSALQNIAAGKAFTAVNLSDFYDFEIDNSAGVSVTNDIEISNRLTLTEGVLYTDAGGSLALTKTNPTAEDITAATGKASSYIDGPMIKKIADGDSFVFPVGDQSRYSPIEINTDGIDTDGGGSDPEIWEVEYYNDSYSDVSTLHDVAYVSHGEYWRAEGPDTEEAIVTLWWDDLSGVNPDDTNSRMVQYTSANGWSSVAASFDDVSSSVASSADVVFNEYNPNGNYFTFGSLAIVGFEWDGDISSDWFTAGNWEGGVVPSAGSDVTIDAGDTYEAEISGAASVNSLTITTGALTLKPGSQLTVSGALATNNALTVQNSVTNPTSIITNGSVSGNATYTWTGFANLSWYHIAHPVNGVTTSEYDTSFGASNFALNRYNAGAWERVAGLNNIGAYTFNDPLEGYSLNIRYASQTLTYSGELNFLSSYLDNTYTDGWYQVANPYPSYIDVEEVGFDMGDFLQTIYIDGYDKVTHTYNIETNVGVNGGSRYIAPGQCMWLRTYTATADAISIANSTRVHSTGSLKSAMIEDNNIFRMEVSDGSTTDESVVLYSAEFGSELITRYDSEKKMNGGDVVNIYSIKEAGNMAINALPELLAADIVPIGYKVSDAGALTFKATNIVGFMPEVDVYLVDKLEGIEVDLREDPVYPFTSSITESSDRFELRFEAAVITDIEKGRSDVSQRNVVIYSAKQEATVKVTQEVLQKENRIIEVYNVAGQLVEQLELNDVETVFDLPQANTMYIINVKVNNSSYQQKVLAK